MPFTYNKYTRWYYSIITNAKERVLSTDVYTERHHIMPRSLGGNNNKDNIANLTAREHFICHWLLTKMVISKKHHYQMWNAFSCMLYRENPNQERHKVSSKVFENIKTVGAKIKSEKFSGKNNPMFGRTGKLCPSFGKKATLETRAKQSAAHKGKLRTEEAKAKQSKTNKGKPKSDEHRKKMSLALSGANNPMYGKKLSAETIAKRTASMQRNKLAKKLAQENQNS